MTTFNFVKANTHYILHIPNHLHIPHKCPNITKQLHDGLFLKKEVAIKNYNILQLHVKKFTVYNLSACS